jgi:hypothetical protein
MRRSALRWTSRWLAQKPSLRSGGVSGHIYERLLHDGPYLPSVSIYFVVVVQGKLIVLWVANRSATMAQCTMAFMGYAQDKGGCVWRRPFTVGR